MKEPIADAANGLDYGSLPGRDLDARELRDLAASIALTPQLWGNDVGFDDDQRHYVSLYRDTHVDVWILCWTPQNDTGWHDHDVSSGSVAVVSGCLTEANLSVDGPDAMKEVPAGDVFSFGPDHIHRLSGLADKSVSIHVYSPPLWRMGQYAVDEAGMLRRTSVSYADELRPIEPLTSMEPMEPPTPMEPLTGSTPYSLQEIPA